MSKTVTFVYFADACNWDINFYAVFNGYKKHSVALEDYYNQWVASGGSLSLRSLGDKFYGNLEPDNYYFFIFTKEQMKWEVAEREFKRLNIAQYEVWRSREYAENSNYPGDARLLGLMLYIPKDFVQEKKQ